MTQQSTLDVPVTIDQVVEVGQEIRQKYGWFYQVALIGIVFFFGILVGGEVFGVGRSFADDGYSMNLYTEGISLLLTVGIIDILTRRREEHRRLEQLREKLLLQLKSSVRVLAVEALDDVRINKWHTGDNSILQSLDLRQTDFQGANFTHMNLSKTNFTFAKMNGANFTHAHVADVNLTSTQLNHTRFDDVDLSTTSLKGASFRGASLAQANLSNQKLMQLTFDEAILYRANVVGANLSLASFRNASLNSADFSNAVLTKVQFDDASLRQAIFSGAVVMQADFRGANLVGANFKDTKGIETALFDERTVLPDAIMTGHDANGRPIYTSESYWSSDVDMTRYTV